MRDYLRDGRNGLFISPDPLQLADRFQQLAQDPSLLARLASEARDSVADRDWLVVARRFLQLCKQL